MSCVQRITRKLSEARASASWLAFGAVMLHHAARDWVRYELAELDRLRAFHGR
jgi:hypothetical protein